MLIGYVRVSKSDGTQTLAPQRDAMLAAGVDPTRVYEDLASGRHDARPGLTACLNAIQPGNALVLWKLDRLGRDLRHLVNTVEELRTRGVGLKVPRSMRRPPMGGWHLAFSRRLLNSSVS
jgi:DNA invertase Pin-like site-specific DNA recombinase